MASLAGSGVLSCLGLLLVCLLTLLVLRYYLPLRSNPAYLVIPVYLAIAIPASIILLVPVDLVSSAGTDVEGVRGIWLPERVLLVSWRLSYWISFALTWVILPLLGEYEDSGYREPKERTLYSLRSNGQYYALMVGSCVLAGIYFFITSGFRPSSVKALVMALAYAWGLILAIFLMGHGLVTVPRRLFKNASMSDRLRRLQIRAPKVHERLAEAVDNLAFYEAQVAHLQQRKNGSVRNYQEWIDDLVEICALPESRVAPIPRQTSSLNIPNVITDRYLADLTRKLKRARHKKLRFTDEWDALVRDATDTQAILDCVGSKRLEFGQSAPHSSFVDRMNILTPYTRYLAHTKVIPASRYLLSAILALASVTIVWSEVMKAASAKLSLVGMTVVQDPHSDRPRIGFGGQLIASLWVLYMCVAALTSVTEVKIWGNRALVKRGTYAESACWYSSLVCRLTVPLAYNFLTSISPDVYKDTAFYQFLGESIDFTALGRGFSRFFPIFLLLPICAALFNLYGKVQKALGFGSVMEEEDETNPAAFGTGGWREGRTLIDREVQGGASTHGLGLAPRASSPTGRSQSPDSRPQPQARPERRAPMPARNAADDQVGEDGGFFDDFAHRVRNTFDTTERPAWMDNIKKPKWLGGVEESGGSGTNEAGGSGSNETGLARWFGGRSAEGRVRL